MYIYVFIYICIKRVGPKSAFQYITAPWTHLPQGILDIVLGCVSQ